MQKLWTLLKGVMLWALIQLPIGLLCGFFLLAVVVAYFAQEVPDHAQLANYSPAGITRLYTMDGKLLEEYADEHRITVPITAIPDCVRQAFIAIEDRRFYTHHGIDLRGLARALLNNARGRSMQGASTITQQVAKNILLSKERRLTRKLKEMIVALRMTKALSKDRVLELYLNEIFLGQQAYGVAVAAQRYFNKGLLELQPEECALLAALPKAPTTYNPYRNYNKAKHRRNLVLNAMQEEGYLTPAETQAAKETEIVLVQERDEAANVDTAKASFFSETVRQKVLEQVDTHVFYRGGLSIFTTLDSQLQTIAQNALEAELTAYETRQKENEEIDATLINGAVVVMDVHSGQVRAMVGGRAREDDFFNRAVQAKRQPGSAFKPFVYLAALEQGYSPADLVDDAEIYFTDAKTGEIEWKPKNYSGKYYGPTTIRRGLERSLNVMTVHLGMVVGLDHIHELAVRFGVLEENAGKVLSMVLGTQEATLLDMSVAYAMLANGGVKLEASLVSHVRDAAGNVVMSDANYRCDSCNTPRNHPPLLVGEKEYVADPASVSQLVSIMQGVIKRGTAMKARKLNMPLAGKTGTTNDSKDSWFIGFSPDYVVGVYAGLDQPASLGKKETGASIALPIFIRVMEGLYEGKEKPAPFRSDKTLTRKVIDVNTGMLPSEETADRHYLSELFKQGQAPQRALFPFEPLQVIASDLYFATHHAMRPIPAVDDLPPLTDLPLGEGQDNQGIEDVFLPPVIEGVGSGIY